MLLIVSLLGMLIPGLVIVLLLRNTRVGRTPRPEWSEDIDLSWRDYRPLHRLLDPADFDYLRRRGISERRIQKLRAERRKIYRLCLRSLAQDFGRLHSILRLLLMDSRLDRPDLVAELARQQIIFRRNLLLAQFRLLLHCCGFRIVPCIDLVKPLEILQSQLQMLAVPAAA
jgi:hypothetical protein